MKLRVEISDPKHHRRQVVSCVHWPVRIGRRPELEIALSGPGSDVVSVEHATIQLVNQELTLTDAGSTNGTYLNGQRLSGTTQLRVDDEIVLGQDGVCLRILELSCGASETKTADNDPWSVQRRETPVSENDANHEVAVEYSKKPFVLPSGVSSSKSASLSQSFPTSGTRPSSDTRGLVLQLASRQRWTSAWVLGAVALSAIVLTVVAFRQPSAVSSPKRMAGSAIFRQTLPGTILIHSRLSPTTEAHGTGFLIDAKRKLAVTNAHVVEQANRVRVWFPRFDDHGEVITDREQYDDGTSIEADVLLADETRDLALLQLLRIPADASALPLAQIRPATGDTVSIIGNPGSYDESLWIFGRGTVNATVPGWIGNFKGGRQVKADVIITDHMTIQGGASGGPVLNEQGEVVGVNQGSQPWSIGSDGTRVPLSKRFCIAVSELHDLLSQYDRK